MSAMTHPAIIIGAGLSGLACAAQLQRTGYPVLVLEKSRGSGGRAATRRWDSFPIDHGAQFFTARSDAFRQQVDQWLESGICHPWTTGFHRFRQGILAAPGNDTHPRYGCREGMSTLGRALAAAENITIERQAKVVSVQCNADIWQLTCEDGRDFHARTLVITAPPPQGAALLADAAPAAAELLRGLAMDPCLAVVARWPRREIAWQGIQSDDAIISWIGHDTSKRPDLHPDHTVIVIHATPEFSREHYAKPESEVVLTLLDRASVIAGDDLSAPEASFLQRWRYAQPVTPRGGEPAVLYDAPAPLVLAGESFAGGKIEGAWLSGRATAELLVPRPEPQPSASGGRTGA